MSQRRLLKYSLACLLTLAAISLGPQDAHAQTPSSDATPPASTSLDATASGTSRTSAAKSSAASDGGGLKAAASTGFYAPSRLLDEGATRRPSAVEGAGARAASGALTDEGAAQGGGQQQAQQQPAQTYTPLTPEGKMRRAFRRSFLSPEGYVRSAVAATLTEWGEDDLPHKTTEDRLADGLTRFAIKFSNRAARTLLGSGVYPILFKQDPRYERSRSKNVGRRALHAMSRVFVTRGDDGSLQPNYSRWAGSLSASALSNLWEQSTPGHDRIGTDATFRRFGWSFVTDAWQTAVFGEFLPDIIKIFKR